MFGPAGLAYVYLVYGMHDCLNVVTGIDGAASAVLVRAAESVEGRERMIEARTRALARRGPPARPPAPHRIATGPGVLCAAFSVDRALNGIDLCEASSPLRLELPLPDDRTPVEAWTSRVGVAYAGPPWATLRWRLVDRSSAALSAPVPEAAPSEPDQEPAEDAATSRLPSRRVSRPEPGA
jgi:DNA-3-methyladenine glycosylase